VWWMAAGAPALWDRSTTRSGRRQSSPRRRRSSLPERSGSTAGTRGASRGSVPLSSRPGRSGSAGKGGGSSTNVVSPSHLGPVGSFGAADPEDRVLRSGAGELGSVVAVAVRRGFSWSFPFDIASPRRTGFVLLPGPAHKGDEARACVRVLGPRTSRGRGRSEKRLPLPGAGAHGKNGRRSAGSTPARRRWGDGWRSGSHRGWRDGDERARRTRSSHACSLAARPPRRARVPATAPRIRS